jgi:hypothetical protein
MYVLDHRLYVQTNSSGINDHNINLKHTAASKNYVMWEMLLFLEHAVVIINLMWNILQNLFLFGII